MNLTPCSAATSMLGSDLELAVHQQTLTKLVIAETAVGFYVLARVIWAPDTDWYLTTRRDRTRPRLFRDLSRLNDLLRESYPTARVELLRHQTLPAAGDQTDHE